MEAATRLPIEMEMTGVCVDRDKLYDLSKSFAGQLEQLEQHLWKY